MSINLTGLYFVIGVPFSVWLISGSPQKAGIAIAVQMVVVLMINLLDSFKK